MEKKEFDEIRKLIQSTTTKKTVKDIRSSAMQDLSEEIGATPQAEFLKAKRTLSKLRTRLAAEKNKLTKDEKNETVIDRIDTILKTPIPSPQPVVIREGVYRFRDKSESDLQTYNNVMNMNIDLSYSNRSSEIETVISDARAEIEKLDHDMWKEKKSFKLNIPTIGEITIEGN